jgi:replicative DNA helicase
VTERTLPHDLDAERSILGAVLLHGDVLAEAADLVAPEDFFRDAHRRIYRAMIKVEAAGHQVDMVTLREELGRAGDLDECGGPAYISALIDGVPRSTNMAAYAGIVLEKAHLRTAIQCATKLSSGAYSGEAKASDLASDAAERLLALGGDSLEGQAVLLSALVAPSIEALEKAVATGGGAVTGLPTGFAKLDEMCGGLQPGDLTLIAARTSQGKTALALNIAKFAAYTTSTLVFSMEMSKEQLFMRQLSAEAEVDSHRLRTGLLADADWGRIGQAIGTLSDLKLRIDDRGGLGVRELRARCRQVQAKHGLGLVVVDYLQLMRGRGNFDNRTQEIGTISRGLKQVARELRVPVVALSQLSRQAEAKPGQKARRPQLSDLAESGSLENDADVVLMIYRPEAEDDDMMPVAEVIVAKQRNGPVGTVRLAWNAPLLRFEDL